MRLSTFLARVKNLGFDPTFPDRDWLTVGFACFQPAPYLESFTGRCMREFVRKSRLHYYAARNMIAQ